MLKKYIRSTLESFLGSKSSWVGELVGANPSKAVLVATSASSDFMSYTAPSNGILTLRALGSVDAVEIQYLTSDQKSYGCTLLSGVGGGVAAYLKKGQSCKYLLRPTPGGVIADSVVYFYPSV